MTISKESKSLECPSFSPKPFEEVSISLPLSDLGGDILALYPIARRIPATNSYSSSKSRAEILSLMNSLWGVIPFILDMKSMS
jgi:hypothetical protein